MKEFFPQMQSVSVKFAPGQLVVHKKHGYRGVVIEVDESFKGTEKWYEETAKSRPPKDKPWYHVLVDGGERTTYVAERHLELDSSEEPISHPMVSSYFKDFKNGRYERVLH